MTLLVIFGSLFCIWATLMIAVPYMMGRAELLTAWNLYLAGATNFVGISAIQSGMGVDRGDFFVPSRMVFSQWVYIDFVLGAVTFFATLTIAYYKISWPKRSVEHRFQNWPAGNPQAMSSIAVVAMAITVVALAAMILPGLSSVAPDIAEKMSVIAAILAIILWLKQPGNPARLMLVGSSLFLSLIAILAHGSTRRMLLSLILGAAITVYWMRLRYLSRTKTVAILAVGAVAGILFLGAYNTIRHGTQQEGSGALEKAFGRLTHIVTSAGASDEGAMVMLGGDTTDVSLVAIDIYAVSKIESPQPFFTLWYVLCNPVPRILWDDKPEALGSTLAQRTGQWQYGQSNWGPGIVGHGFHEGGLIMLAFYGVLFGVFLRYIDELLARHCQNGYLLAVIAGFSGQFPALSRGDIAVFAVQILVTIVIGLAFMYLVRFFVGTERWT